MSIGFLFWLLMLLWIIFDIYWGWPNWRTLFPRSLFLWILLALLGWKVFGAMVHA